MGRHDRVRPIQAQDAAGKTAALLERRKRGCIDYELLTISSDHLDRPAIGPAVALAWRSASRATG